MIALPLPYDDAAPEEEARRSGSRSGRTAANRRRVRSRRLRYAGLARLTATAAALTLCIVVYLALMANVTRMNYELQKVLLVKASLLDESSRLDDRIARLESRERLGFLAEKLGMREPQTLSEIALPRPHVEPAPRGIAFLTWLR